MYHTSILWEIHRSYGKYIDPMGNGLKKRCPLCYISNKKRVRSFLFFALGEVGLDFGFSTSMGVRVNETTFLDGFTKNGSCVGWCFKDCLLFD